MVLDDYKLIFIHVPRTGGTSVEAAIAGSDWWTIDADTKHLSASMTRVLAGEDRWRDYFKCSLVRNPWDRIISMYATGWWWRANPTLDQTTPPTLFDFIEHLRPHPHEKSGAFFYHELLNEEMDFVGRYENLESDFRTICLRAGVPPKELPHFERRSRGHYSLYFDDLTAEAAHRMFKSDIEQYGYSFEREEEWDPDALRTLCLPR